MHEIPWIAKPTFSSASVIAETLYADKIDYFFLTAASFFLPPISTARLSATASSGLAASLSCMLRDKLSTLLHARAVP